MMVSTKLEVETKWGSSRKVQFWVASPSFRRTPHEPFEHWYLKALALIWRGYRFAASKPLAVELKVIGAWKVRSQ